jgi:hypothetical protein
MSMQRLAADLRVDGFGLVLDGATRRLDFPRGELDELKGTAGNLQYGARDVVLDRLFSLLGRTHWQADAASAGALFLRTVDGALDLQIERIEMPHGVAVTSNADGGVELLSPHASLHDVLLRLPDLGKLKGSKPAEAAATALVKAVDVPLRAEKLHWLDTLAGKLSVTVKVVLDLPIVGTRTLDQKLEIPIQDGSLDFRALDRSLDWLEGAFVDLGIRNDRLVLSWRVPIVGSRREIVSWELDADARTLATFDRVPLRSLADFRFPQAGADSQNRAPSKKKSPLRSLTLSDIKVELSMVAPRSVEIGHGTLQFGGEDEPGVVGLQLTGSLVHPPAPGGLTGAIGVVDITAKDVGGGPAMLTVDRLTLGDLETFDLTFDGFTPIGLTARIHRITASNLSLRLGRS